MTEIIAISLENEMDLVLSHKRTMKVAEKLGLTVATQTTFATAVSEAARTIIEHTDSGILSIYVSGSLPRYALTAHLVFDSEVSFSRSDEGFYYAQKLVPEFNLSTSGSESLITMQIGIPRSLKLDPVKIKLLKDYFDHEPPLNAYEEIKKRNFQLSKITGEQEEELRQAKFIDEKKREFISIASHEIKTPITIIKAYAQMLKSLNADCSDRANEIINKLNGQTIKLTYLANQLMDVSKVENGSLEYNYEEVGINGFIDDILSVLKYVYPSNEVEISACQEVSVSMDKLRMEQVLSNLIGNASKYSAKNSLIRVKSSLDKDHVKVAVSDSGIGMSAENLDRIFEKFYRQQEVSNTHPGLGMGLYITSKIISDHGGKIWVDSEYGKGSTFYFTIPLSR
ncbi:ATP-binding protein [Pedobacter sp. GR22-6]|uniref:ATP-binding protein n=1 Tax=Pedobacter sp. GR22-6 TaxID=3127957 RepID=UPI00307D10DD